MNQSFFPLIESNKSLPLYVHTVGKDYTQGHVNRPNGLIYHQWIYCIEGIGTLLIDDKKFVIDRNTGFFVRAGVRHEYFPQSDSWETHWIGFDGCLSTSFLDTIDVGQYGVYHLNDTRYMDQLLSGIMLSVQSKSLYASSRCSSLLYNYFMELSLIIRDYGTQENKQVTLQLKNVLEFMEEHMQQDISLSDIANCIRVSEQYLCRIFKHKLMISPYEYLMRTRMNRAKELLINKDTLIKDILVQTGFKDASYFSAVFRKYEGITPTQFRNMYFS